MNKLIGTTIKTTPYSFVQNNGISESADNVQRASNELRKSFARSITFGDRLTKMLEGLFEAGQKYSVENWDGYAAKAVNEQSYKNAIRFILSLPSDTHIPEIYVDPDGEIAFEWYEGRRQVFSISVGSRNELSYAGLYGAANTYGIEYLYDYIPDTIIENINKVYSRGI